MIGEVVVRWRPLWVRVPEATEIGPYLLIFEILNISALYLTKASKRNWWVKM